MTETYPFQLKVTRRYDLQITKTGSSKFFIFLMP